MKRSTLLLALLLALCASTALAQNLGSAEAYYNRGLDRQGAGDLDGAITDYDKAISMKPKQKVLAIIYNGRANARMGKDDLDGAIADYSKAIETDPKEFEYHY